MNTKLTSFGIGYNIICEDCIHKEDCEFYNEWKGSILDVNKCKNYEVLAT